jgi:hypothetical protein
MVIVGTVALPLCANKDLRPLAPAGLAVTRDAGLLKTVSIPSIALLPLSATLKLARSSAIRFA